MLDDDEVLAAVRRCMFATDAGYGFYPPDDERRDRARAVAPLPGYVTLDLSGDRSGLTVDDRRITLAQFATVVRTLVETGELTLREGEGIRLRVPSASTWATDVGQALGIEVSATLEESTVDGA
jgi:hypothetical protein